MKIEKESLRIMTWKIPSSVPHFLSMGKLTNGGFLVTSYFSFGESNSKDAQISLAKKLTQLHSIEPSDGKFGFHVGKNNQWKDSWEKFFLENRWQPLWEKFLQKYPQDEEMKKRGGIISTKIIPYLLGNLKVNPVLLHGDLWNGNWAINSITNESVIFDPASYYGHNEIDIAKLIMIDSLEKEFFEEYFKHHPKQESNFEERKELYNLYEFLELYYSYSRESYRNICLDIMNKLKTKWEEFEGESKIIADQNQEQQAQILQPTSLPYGTLGSSK